MDTSAYDKKMILDLKDRYDRMRMKEFYYIPFHKVTYHTTMTTPYGVYPHAIAYDEITGEFECDESYPVTLHRTLEDRKWFAVAKKLWKYAVKHWIAVLALLT